jgi:hypothetical protein
LVDAFYLAIGLRVVRRAHTELCLRHTEQLPSERAGEDVVVVKDNVHRHPVEAVYVVEEQLCYLLSSKWV